MKRDRHTDTEFHWLLAVLRRQRPWVIGQRTRDQLATQASTSGKESSDRHQRSQQTEPTRAASKVVQRGVHRWTGHQSAW
jgi:hypothetical protein